MSNGYQRIKPMCGSAALGDGSSGSWLKAGPLACVIGEALVLLPCSIQEPRSAWSVCSHSLALIQISGRTAISWMSSSTSGKERILTR